MGAKLETLIEEIWPPLRDVIFVCVGLGLLIHEALGEARPSVMGVFLVLAGVPVPLRADTHKKKRRERQE